MSPSDRPTDRPGATLPTEQIPAVRVAERGRWSRPNDDGGEIVPAVRDPAHDEDEAREAPDVAIPVVSGRPPSATVPGTDLETTGTPTAWTQDEAPPVVVTAPADPNLRPTGRRPRVRRTTRTIRHLDPWSVFKVALVCSFVLYGVVLTSGVLLWNVASRTGTVDNVERWFTQFGWETFELNGGEIYSNAWVAGLFAAVGLTGLAVLMATVFNLVSDIVGGVRVTVLEDDVVERTASPARRYVVQRPPSAPPGARGGG